MLRYYVLCWLVISWLDNISILDYGALSKAVESFSFFGLLCLMFFIYVSISLLSYYIHNLVNFMAGFWFFWKHLGILCVLFIRLFTPWFFYVIWLSYVFRFRAFWLWFAVACQGYYSSVHAIVWEVFYDRIFHMFCFCLCSSHLKLMLLKTSYVSFCVFRKLL